jgi:hypothetical protein
MTLRNRASALLAIQCLLVASIAAKFLYERATRPRVWVRAALNDSQFALRGRYLELYPMTDICRLTPSERNDYDPQDPLDTYHVRLVARDGKLVAVGRVVDWNAPLCSFDCNSSKRWPTIDPENS